MNPNFQKKYFPEKRSEPDEFPRKRSEPDDCHEKRSDQTNFPENVAKNVATR
jgi:hypothetical protein